MEYWSEKCPYCGAKTRRSSIDNEKTFDTPLVVCKSCGKTYIHPDRIEIGMLPPNGRKWFARKMMFSMLWRAVFLGGVGFCIASYCGLSDKTAIVIGIAVCLLLACLSRSMINRTIAGALKESEKRLETPGYKELLKKAGYEPHW